MKQRLRNVYMFLKRRFRAQPVRSTLIYLVLPIYILFGVHAMLFGAPRFFPTDSLVQVESGMSVSDAADALKGANVIRSTFFFKGFATVFGGNVREGGYAFERPVSVITVAWRTTRGVFGIERKRVVVPEGATVADMAVIFGKRLYNFDESEFLRKASDMEGYLFPDTYFFLPTASVDEVIKTMRDTFDTRIAEIQTDIDAFGKPLDEVVIMASLLEKEARKLDTKRMIADILWRRIDIGMPLQVDAVFPYIIGLNTFELSKTDLNVDSPYNTYRYKGLPIGPIANPGLDSILAAVTPTENNYLFYLADHYGTTHYAADFDGHKVNRRKYLD